MPVPPPVRAAPVAGLGNEAEAGAADVRGPGTGLEGQGYGTGSGEGEGGGSTPARLVSGRIKGSDYPRREFDAGVEGIVGVRLWISDRGRVDDCVVTRSSGSPALDDTTCRLIIKRFRYRPAFDGTGRPIASEEQGAQEWTIRGRGDPDEN